MRECSFQVNPERLKVVINTMFTILLILTWMILIFVEKEEATKKWGVDFEIEVELPLVLEVEENYIQSRCAFLFLW